MRIEIEPIARFRAPFATKFGAPKQSGLVETLQGTIVFEKQYSDIDAVRGLESFDYLWLIWGFSANKHVSKAATVRPPLLGGNARMGVFATRSPYRPNGLGLSSVKIAGIEYDGQGCLCIDVLGADLIDNTPIYDIKPYLSYADAHPQARCGFVDETPIVRLTVNIPELLAARLQGVNLQTLTDLLALDPRPHYQNKPDKIYGFVFQNFEIKFKVNQNVLTVTEVLTL